MIETLLGPVPPGALGLTYVHEHLLTRPPDWRVKEDPDYLLDDPERAWLSSNASTRRGCR